MPEFVFGRVLVLVFGKPIVTFPVSSIWYKFGFHYLISLRQLGKCRLLLPQKNQGIYLHEVELVLFEGFGMFGNA